MEPKFIFVSSALKHGVTKEDIVNAYRTMIHRGKLKDYDNKYAYIGFNMATNPIEVYYNPIGDDTIKVFHAMDFRESTLEKID